MEFKLGAEQTVVKTYNKLVRDKVPEICEANGDTPRTRIINNDQEYLAALLNKLLEEAQEIVEDPNIEELVDTLEIVHSVGKALGYTPEQLETARVEKASERGSFNQRIFLISTDHE